LDELNGLSMYPRYATQNVKKALTDTPVVFVMGPRQVGKTTLVKSLINNALLLPRLSDSLAGRMESMRLTPLSECEIQGHPPHPRS